MKEVKIIAEIGWNHFGDIHLAKEMITQASKNGADYAKFQTWSVKRLKQGSWDTDGRREIYKKAELSIQDHQKLIDHCELNNIKFLSSVFSIEDAKVLIKVGVKEVKIPSFESRNTELLKFCDKHFESIFMSTGTSTIDEISLSITNLNKSKLYLMHCVSMYPCKFKNANLPKMKHLQKIHPNVGYSDHIVGVESAKIAIGEGAKVIEKHFTLNNDLPGRDNKFAILPTHLKELREYIDSYNEMMINHGLGFQEGEKDSRLNYTGRFDG